MAKRDIQFLVRDLEALTIQGAAEAAVEIMNALVEAGPGYTGDFSSSWYTIAPGKSAGGPRNSSGLYNYTLRNVPKTKFKTTGVYSIVNTSPYAAQAMDLVPYTKPLPDQEIPDRVVTTKNITTGKRDEGATRGEVSGSGKATSTAPADWWFTFGRGGGLSSSLAKGFKRGFKQPLRFGKARGFG